MRDTPSKDTPEPDYEARVAEQLKGLETRHVYNIARNAKQYGEQRVFIPLLPRGLGEWRLWDDDDQEVVDGNDPAGYVYPVDMLEQLTKRWLNEFRWTI